MKKKISVMMILFAFIMMVFTGTINAKSLYVITDINASPTPISAYNINVDGTIALQSTHQVPRHGWGAVGLAIDTESEFLFVTYEASDTIELIDARTMTSVGNTNAPNAINLAGIVVDQSRKKVYTIDRNTSNLYIYSWDANSKTLTLDGGSYISLPSCNGFGMALDEINGILYVANNNSTVTYYNTSDFTKLAGSINVGFKAVGIAVDAINSYLYTGAGWGSGRHDYINQYNLSTGETQSKYIGSNEGVMGISVDLLTGNVFCTTGQSGDMVVVYDKSLNYLYATARIGNPTGLVVPSRDISYNPLNLAKNNEIAGQGVSIGSEFTYKITCKNTTGMDAEDVTLIDNLPIELDYVSSTKDGIEYGIYDSINHTVAWELGNIPYGETGPLIELKVKVNQNAAPGETIYNNCTIEGSNIPPTTVIDIDSNSPNGDPGISVNDGKQQVLFIPGIMSSKLWEEKNFLLDDQIWPTLYDWELKRLSLDSDGGSQNPIYIKNGYDGIIDEYVGFNVYKKFINDVMKNDTNNEWHAFSYDWRLDFSHYAMLVHEESNVCSSVYETLKAKIKEMAQNDPDGKIDIVAHSMGGVLAKYYIDKCHNDSSCNIQVDKLLLVACPQLGTPAGAIMMTHGEHGLTENVIFKHKTFRNLVQNMPSIFLLMPSKDYFGEFDKNTLDTGLFFTMSEPFPHDDLKAFIYEYGDQLRLFGNIRTYEEWKEFHNDPGNLGTDDDGDCSRPLNPSERRKELFKDYGEKTYESLGKKWDPILYGVNKVYQIVGQNYSTLAGIEYFTDRECLLHHGDDACDDDNDPPIEYRPKHVTNGDGTVITQSAEALFDKGAITYYVDLENHNDELLWGARRNRKHNDILEIEGVQKQIKNLLAGKEDKVDNDYISMEKPEKTSPWLIIIVRSPVEIHVYDSLRNHTGLTDEGYVEENVPNSRYGTYGNKHTRTYVILPLDYDELLVDFEGIDTGSFSVTFEKYNEKDELVATKHFLNIPVTDTYMGRMSFTSFEDITKIQNDADGDGVYEYMLPAARFVKAKGAGVYEYFNEKIKLNMNIKADLASETYEGHVNFNSEGQIVASSTEIKKVTIEAKTANTITVEGLCRVQNQPGAVYEFRASIFDGGIPGIGLDMAGIEIIGPNDIYYHSFGKLTGGDFKLEID